MTTGGGGDDDDDDDDDANIVERRSNRQCKENVLCITISCPVIYPSTLSEDNLSRIKY